MNYKYIEITPTGLISAGVFDLFTLIVSYAIISSVAQVIFTMKKVYRGTLTNMKKRIVNCLLILAMITATCGCSILPGQTNTDKETNTEDASVEKLIEFAASDTTIEEKTEEKVQEKYDPEINDDLLGAIEQLALSFDEFNSEVNTKKDHWQRTFIDHYIRGNWDGYSYKKMLEKDYNGIVTKDQVEYIHKSLTGIDLSFDSMKDDETIDVYNSVDATNNRYCNILNYEVTEGAASGAGTTCISAQIEIGSGNSDHVKTYDMYVYLKENPDSCFGGYSVTSLTKTETTVYAEGDGQEHSFYGWYMSDLDVEGEVTIEFGDSEDEFEYGHFVTVKVTDEQKKKIVDIGTSDCIEITYLFSDGMTEPVDEVTAVDVRLFAVERLFE